MKKVYLFLALALTSCGVTTLAPNPPRTEDPNPGKCEHRVVLPSVIIDVNARTSVMTLKPGVPHALVYWQAGDIRGGDNVYAGQSDTVALGCLDKVTFSEK